MKNRSKFQTAALVFLCLSIAAAALILAQPAPRALLIDPSIATITVTAKRLTAIEKIQAAKDDANNGEHAVTAKNPPAGKPISDATAQDLLLASHV
ncbi:MAG: hypothetical protein H7315_01305 [Herminiimonas sp.]|nr:hypothetical protein [Herminiimonas sp.]